MGGNGTFSTIRTLIDRNAMLHPDRVALREMEGDRAYTYTVLRDRVNRMGKALRSLGLEKGERVAILSQNSMEYLECALGVPNAGLIFVVCNFRLAPPEIATVLTDAQPSVLVVQDQFAEIGKVMEQGIPSIRHVVYFGDPAGRPQGWHDYEQVLAGAPSHDVEVEVYEDDVALLMYTSGTTGLPKGVMQTHGNFYHAGRVCSRNNRLDADDRVFIVCPMYHITAHYTFFGSLYAACPAYVFKRWDVPLFLSSVEKERLTAGMFATPMVMMILDYPDHRKYDVSSWRSLWFAGAGIIPSVYKQFIDAFGNILGEHHGTTESTGVTAYLSPRDIAEAFERGEEIILESCGRASFDMEILIVDEHGKPVPAGGVGEMIVRGPGMSLGYWRKEQETAKAFKGEWFHTEDVCSIDERGYIRVIDRLKDMIITGGENVYPAEVEKVLHTHPCTRNRASSARPIQPGGRRSPLCVCSWTGRVWKAKKSRSIAKGRSQGTRCPKSFISYPNSREVPRERF